MRLTIAEKVLLFLQIVCIVLIAWQLALVSGKDLDISIAASLISILALGLGRVRIREKRIKAEIEVIKALQESERSAHELASHLDLSTRREIGYWIHGELQSSLLKIARSLREDGLGEAAEQLSSLNDMVIRAMAHRLYPPQLEVSLQLSLSDLCHERAELTLSDNLNLNSFKDLESIVVPFDIRLSVYRIVEEAITNAEKKLDTTKIMVDVQAVNNLICISVLDDGAVFDTGSQPSLGLTLINSYVRQFNGNWAIKNIDNGVLLTASLAMPEIQTVETFAPARFVSMKKGLKE